MASYTFVVTGFKDGSDNIAWEYTFDTSTETLAATGNTWGIPRATSAACLGGGRRNDGAFILCDYVNGSDARIYKVDSDLSGEDGTFASGTGYIAINEVVYTVCVNQDNNYFIVPHTIDGSSYVCHYYNDDASSVIWTQGALDDGYKCSIDTTNSLAYWGGEDVNADLIYYAPISTGSSPSHFLNDSNNARNSRALHVDNDNEVVYASFDGVGNGGVAKYPVNSTSQTWQSNFLSSGAISVWALDHAGSYVLAGGEPDTDSDSLWTLNASTGAEVDGYDAGGYVYAIHNLDDTYFIIACQSGTDEDANGANLRACKLTTGVISVVDTANIGGAALNMRDVIDASGATIESGACTITAAGALTATGTTVTVESATSTIAGTGALTATAATVTVKSGVCTIAGTSSLSVTGSEIGGPVENYESNATRRLVVAGSDAIWYEDV